MLFLSRRTHHRPAVRLFLLGVLTVWLASAFSFICTRPLLHKAQMVDAECPLASHHTNGAGQETPAGGDGCSGQPCLDEIQSVDFSWNKPAALPALLVVTLIWLWRVALETIPLLGCPRYRPPDRPSVPLIHLFCVLRN